MSGLDQICSQNADVRKVAIPLHEIESVTDHEFVFDLEPHVIGVHMSRPALLLAQEYADFNAAWIGRLQFVSNGGERVTAVENVVEDENMAPDHIRQRDLFE